MTTGSLRISYGPMFAGKTSVLLDDLGRRIDTQPTLKVVMLNHSTDTRAGLFSTHTGTFKIPNIQILQTASLQAVDAFIEHYDYIGIDEAQFFGDLVEYVRKWVDNGKHVYCVGLIADFQQQPFGQLLQLFCCADELYHHQALCTFCVKSIPPTSSPQTLAACKAPFSCKLQKDDTVVEVGGAEKYTALCRKHYNSVTSQLSIPLD